MQRIYKAAKKCGYLGNLIEPIEPKNAKNISMFFENSLIKKTMDDAEEKTLWTQDGSIELRNVKEINSVYKKTKL